MDAIAQRFRRINFNELRLNKFLNFILKAIIGN